MHLTAVHTGSKKLNYLYSSLLRKVAVNQSALVDFKVWVAHLLQCLPASCDQLDSRNHADFRCEVRTLSSVHNERSVADMFLVDINSIEAVLPTAILAIAVSSTL